MLYHWLSVLAGALTFCFVCASVVYTLMEDLEKELLSMLPPTHQEKQLGKAKVLQVFKLTGKRRSTVGTVLLMLFSREANLRHRFSRMPCSNGRDTEECFVQSLAQGQNDP